LATATLHMPKLSDSMVEGTIIRWLKRDGEPVQDGDELVEIETDKATVVYEAEHSGRLTILAGDGATLSVGAVIAEIGEGPAAGARAAGADGSAQSAGNAAAPAPAPADADGSARHRDGSARGAAGSSPRPRASPLARRIASELGVDLSAVAGSGPGGRIVKRDVHDAAAARGADGGADPRGAVTRLVPSASQTTIARRMALAKSTMPEFTLDTEIRMDAVLALRAGASGVAAAELPSLSDFIVKACALALREHPAVNAAFVEDAVERYGRVNVGLAVAAPGTLLVPTIFDADTKSLGRLGRESKALAERARAGRLTPAELSGATFTVSNLGMFGVTRFTAVLNPPQAAILACGAVTERVALRAGEPVAERVLTVTLTCDHRVIYGADGAAFLKTVRENLEEPLRLML